ncbi:MAG: hypothetical protein R3D69_05375 [Xanthobacteraceae bacterium]
MIAPMIGPFIGGVLETTYGWRAIFWFLGLVSLLSRSSSGHGSSCPRRAACRQGLRRVS